MKKNKIDLNESEKKELKIRWFYVKDVLTIKDLFLNIPFHLLLIAIFSGVGFVLWGFIIVLFWWLASTFLPRFMLSIVGFVLVYICIKSLIPYSFLGKFFINDDWTSIAWYGLKLINPMKWKKIIKQDIKSWVQAIKHMIQSTPKKDLYGIPFLATVVIWGIFWDNKFNEVLWVDLLWEYAVPMTLILCFIYGIFYLLRQLVEHFHPLYAFWNIWEKIQKLTPKIEEQSKEIQKNFQSDMNFSVLSSWFDSLSSTFSEIVSLVIKLERVEKKANKWNLFDSTKYINSLRSDIVEPLQQLKTFLEKQRDELLHSQKELQRVRVWGSDPEINSGWQGHGELSSKRSESLLGELTENIAKLDEMIGKMSNQ